MVNLMEHPEIVNHLTYYAYKLIVTSPSAILILGAVFQLQVAEALPPQIQGHCGYKKYQIS